MSAIPGSGNVYLKFVKTGREITEQCKIRSRRGIPKHGQWNENGLSRRLNKGLSSKFPVY